MKEGSLIISYVFMAVVILYSIYQLFLSKKMSELEQEIAEKMQARPVFNVIRYLIFLAFNFYFSNMFFDIGWLLWISFLSVIALGLLIVELKFNKASIISVLIILLFFLGSSVPNHYDSFVEYISEQTEYECLRIECVKVSEVVVDDKLKTDVKIFSIEGSYYDWYLLFAKGALTLKDEEGNIEELKGINIGGLWLLDN